MRTAMLLLPRQVLKLTNPLSLKSDQYQNSPWDINAFRTNW